jgi:hypothetical protein
VAAPAPGLGQFGGKGAVKKPATKPIHHTPAFWLGIALCLVAIAIYLWSDDLSWRPGS